MLDFTNEELATVVFYAIPLTIIVKKHWGTLYKEDRVKNLFLCCQWMQKPIQLSSVEKNKEVHCMYSE